MNSKIWLLAGLFSLSACASSNGKVLDQKLLQEQKAGIDSTAELKQEAKNAIDTDPNLTTEQKQKLTALRLKISSEMDQFNKKSIELRSVLLKNLLSSNFNAAEVDLIKKRMRQLEDQKLTTLFNAADKANLILGRNAASHSGVMQEFISGHEIR